jgi:hypothetical protein
MVIEGKISSEQAQLAMIEQKGAHWDEATERVKMELALRVPTAGTLYAGLHSGPGAAAQAALPSLFGSGLLPAGELEYRGLKGEWNDAWKKYDAGDTGAINRFFDQHPEYEAYLAKGKDNDELLRSFLVGQVWDGYMGLGDTNKKAARSQMGELFTQAFLDKETRSYESIPVETLIEWARMFYQSVPTTPATADAATRDVRQLNLYDQSVTQVSDEFYRQRSEQHPDYYELEQGYYNRPKSEQALYLMEHPRLKSYWDWKKKWYNRFPDLKPIFNGQAFKQVDTSSWPPALEQYIAVYAMTGQKLPPGATASLKQIWIKEGQPNGDFMTWVNTQVVPAMMYQQPQQ